MPVFSQIAFYTSVKAMQKLPLESGREIAFAGRSNAGKSSAINTLTNRGKLAFVSKTPGRTQLINFFQINSGNFLVDLPGYGYAKVPIDVRKHWESLLSSYLQNRQALYGLVLIMDARHPLTPLDLKMLDWFVPTGKSLHILLTKADKLNRQDANKALLKVKNFLDNTYPHCTVQLFSSLKPTKGVNEAKEVIGNWLAAS